MNFQKFFTCQDISHEKDNIQGFCLNFGCISSRSQFCLQCAADPMKHTNCRKDLKGFGQIQLLMIKFQEYLLNLTTQLNKSFEQCKTKYEEYSKQMEKMRINLNQKFAEIKIKNEEYTIQMEKMNTQLVKLSECLIQQDYQYIKQNLQSVKEWYQYFYNQEEIIKQNQIGTSFYIQYDFLIIFTIKRIIKALNQNRYQQSSQIKRLEQEQENILQEGIQLKQITRKRKSILNLQKWQQAYDSQKCQNNQRSNHLLPHSFNNQPGQGFILREQARKINSNFYKDLLNYTDLELKKNPKNTSMMIAQSYALNDEKQYQQAIQQCEKILNEEPENLHALYRKSFSLEDSNQIALAIQCIDKALKYNPNYCLAYFQKDDLMLKQLGNLLYAEGKYRDAIICYDMAIQLDPNYSMAYNNKGNSLYNLQKQNDAITCYEKAFQLDPNYSMAYNNKCSSLDYINNYVFAFQLQDDMMQVRILLYQENFHFQSYEQLQIYVKQNRQHIICFQGSVQTNNHNYIKIFEVFEFDGINIVGGRILFALHFLNQ